MNKKVIKALIFIFTQVGIILGLYIQWHKSHAGQIISKKDITPFSSQLIPMDYASSDLYNKNICVQNLNLGQKKIDARRAQFHDIYSGDRMIMTYSGQHSVIYVIAGPLDNVAYTEKGILVNNENFSKSVNMPQYIIQQQIERISSKKSHEYIVLRPHPDDIRLQTISEVPYGAFSQKIVSSDIGDCSRGNQTK